MKLQKPLSHQWLIKKVLTFNFFQAKMHKFVVVMLTYFQYSIDIQEVCDKLYPRKIITIILVADTIMNINKIKRRGEGG